MLWEIYIIRHRTHSPRGCNNDIHNRRYVSTDVRYVELCYFDLQLMYNDRIDVLDLLLTMRVMTLRVDQVFTVHLKVLTAMDSNFCRP